MNKKECQFSMTVSKKSVLLLEDWTIVLKVNIWYKKLEMFWLIRYNISNITLQNSLNQLNHWLISSSEGMAYFIHFIKFHSTFHFFKGKKDISHIHSVGLFTFSIIPVASRSWNSFSATLIAAVCWEEILIEWIVYKIRKKIWVLNPS